MFRWTSVAFALTFALVANLSYGQIVTNPRFVRFAPSADHDTLNSTGQPVVRTYQLQLYQVGSSQPLLVLDLGKPGAEADGYIYANFSNLLASPPSPGSQLEARVSAVGQGGTTLSTLSGAFVFNGCAPSVAPSSVSVPAQGASASITVSAASGCGWTATSESWWVSVASGATGSGSGTVVLNAGANSTTAERTGLATIAGQTVTLTQAAASSTAPPPPTSGTPPVVQVTSPADGAAYTAPATVTISATATDADGSVKQVSFYANGTLVGTATASPYTLAWANVGQGTYSITAQATDNTGLQTTSQAVTVSVRRKNKHR